MLDQKVIDMLGKEIELLQSRIVELEKRTEEMAIWAFAWEDATMDAAIDGIITFEQRDQLNKLRDKHIDQTTKDLYGE